jgi:hypothetical protein
MNPKKKEPLLLIPPLFTLKPFLGLRAKKQREKFPPCELAGIVGVQASEKVFGFFDVVGPHPSIH